MIYKKVFALFLSVIIFFSLMPSNTSGLSEDACDIILKYTVGNKQYFVNNKPSMMDSEPEIKDSRMFLVIRFVLQNIPGTTLDWNGSEQKITIKTQVGKIIKLWIGNPKAEVNGKMVDIDPENPGNIAPFIKDGRTKVPMRFVGEQVNARIDWISATSTVVLTLFDTFNCDTTLLEGCISKWTEAPNNQYQIYFHKNCDVKKESVPYLISKTLKSKTDHMDLAEYFQLKSVTNKLNTKIWVTRSGKVLSWDPIKDPIEPPPDPKPPEPPASCCDYQLFQVSQPIAKLKAGESNFYVFMLRNNCQAGSKSISFQFAPISNVTEINPKNLVLLPGKELMFKVFFTMPQNALKGSNVNFSFKMGTDCSDKVEHSFMILCDSPEAPPEPPGKKGRILGSISGTCNPGVIITIYDGVKGDVVWTGQTDAKGTYDTSSSINCILKCPGTYKVVPTKEKYIFTEPSKIVVLAADECCDPDSIKLKAKIVNFKAETTAKPGRITVHLGQKCSMAIVTVVNLSNPNQEKMTLEANIKGSCDTDCTMIFGDTYRVTPKREGFKFNPEVIDVKIKDSCPDAITRVVFEAIEVPRFCCDFEFRLIPGKFAEKWSLFPGESKTIEVYEIKNNCHEDTYELPFTITWPNDGKVVSISPASFTLGPQRSKIISITIKMPENCKAEEAVFFPFTINPKDCDKREQHVVAYCKKWKCDATSVILKVLEVDQRNGWVEGTRKQPVLYSWFEGIQIGNAFVIRIEFQTKDSYWKNLEVGKCFEICYDEKKHSDDRVVKWGIDYRLVNCE